MTRDHHQRVITRGAAYGACALGLAYALVSLYWGVGGTIALNTLGGSLERLARSRNATAAIVVAAVIVAKLAVSALALALVQSWGQRLPRRSLTTIAWIVSIVLIGYGGIEVLTESLVETGVIRPGASVDWRALRWHLGLWDSWFLLWGVLLAIATFGVQRSRQPSDG